MKSKCIIFCSFVILTLIFYKVSFAFDDGDFQFWNTEAVSWKIADDWKLDFQEELYWGDNASNPYYNHLDIGIIYSGLYDWLDLAFYCRHINEERSGDWKRETRPHLNATVKFDLGDFKASNRGRLEYRDREDADNLWRYRNKLTLKFPWKFTRLAIQPYLAEEAYYDFDAKRLNKSRFYAGIALKLFGDLSGEIYYFLQRSKSSSTKKWTDINVLGTKLKLSF